MKVFRMYSKLTRDCHYVVALDTIEAVKQLREHLEKTTQHPYEACRMEDPYETTCLGEAIGVSNA